MTSQVFQRVEQKYLINQKQYEILKSYIQSYMEEDCHGESTIRNIYFDTKEDELIRNSIEKPAYKEKIRVRSYGITNDETPVFLEIKKKYDGVVGKRRILLTLKQANDYFEKGILPEKSQVMKEIDYCFKHYALEKKLYLAYDRIAYFEKNNPDFRLTFDHNVRSRRNRLYLEESTEGRILVPRDKYIMEVKSMGGIPLWFTKILTILKIYPTSFSKYGEIFKTDLLKEEKNYV